MEFTQMHPRLFTPVDKPQTAPGFGPDIPPDVPREVVVAFQQMFDELAPKAIAEREALLAANPSGRVLIPQYRVSNAIYEPLLSPAGGPIGIRVSYEIMFPQSGRYSAALGIRGENLTRGDGVVDDARLHTLKSTIVPRPREVHAPEQEAQDYPGLFQQGTDFLYEKGTVYRFTVDLVPKYIRLDKDRVTLCISQYERRSHRNFDRMIAPALGNTAERGRHVRRYPEWTFPLDTRRQRSHRSRRRILRLQSRPAERIPILYRAASDRVDFAVNIRSAPNG